MMQFLEDIVADKFKSEAVVKLATGALMSSPLRGNIKIHIEDIYTHMECFILLYNVLSVPELNRRLLRVKKWNNTGGDILFELNHCTLRILDSESNLNFNIHVRPLYAAEQKELHVNDANSASTTNTVEEETNP